SLPQCLQEREKKPTIWNSRSHLLTVMGLVDAVVLSLSPLGGDRKKGILAASEKAGNSPLLARRRDRERLEREGLRAARLTPRRVRGRRSALDSLRR
ncbi:MAG TPA: hypothetical protein VES58_10180, partial [Syntrophobacteria bacterium]|nr:hypothetical protein [Syntrophobacteria bacterium]